MENLPDFSMSKIEIKNRIEGAIREKRKKPYIPVYQYSLFFCLFIFTSVCTGLYLRTIMGLGRDNSDPDYYALEQLMLSEQFESETVIKLPDNLSLASAAGMAIRKGDL